MGGLKADGAPAEVEATMSALASPPIFPRPVFETASQRYRAVTSVSMAPASSKAGALPMANHAVVVIAHSERGEPAVDVLCPGHAGLDEPLVQLRCHRRAVTALAIRRGLGSSSSSSRGSSRGGGGDGGGANAGANAVADAEDPDATLLVCSGSRDAVLLWVLRPPLPPAPRGAAPLEVHERVLLATPETEVEALAYDPTGLLVAACVGATVEVLTTAARPADGGAPEPLMRLEGHGSAVMGACFLPHQPHVLVTIAASAFRVWVGLPSRRRPATPVLSLAPLDHHPTVSTSLRI